MITAAGAAPAAPFAAAAAAPAVAPTPVQFAWAAHYARVHNTASPARLVAALKVSPQIADGLMAKLIDARVIYAPTANGISAAYKPRPTTQYLRQASHNPTRITRRNLKTRAKSDTVEPTKPNQPDADTPNRITPPPLRGHLNSLR